MFPESVDEYDGVGLAGHCIFSLRANVGRPVECQRTLVWATAGDNRAPRRISRRALSSRTITT